jgi:hypothetical protein
MCQLLILHEVPAGAMYEEVTEALENHYGDHHLEAALHSQQKRAQLIRESLHEFAAATNHLAYHAHIKMPVHLISKEAAHAFVDRIRQQDIRRQLLLVGGGQEDTQKDPQSGTSTEGWRHSSRNTFQGLANDGQDILEEPVSPPPQKRRNYLCGNTHHFQKDCTHESDDVDT